MAARPKKQIRRILRLRNHPESIPFTLCVQVHGSFTCGGDMRFPNTHLGRILWSKSGTGVGLVDGEEMPIGEGEFFIWLPPSRQGFRATSPWKTVWWTLEGDLARAILEGLGFNRSGAYAGRAPSAAMIERIAGVLRDRSPDADHRNSVLAYELLATIACRPDHRERDELVEQAKEIVEIELSSPRLSVEFLADELGTSRYTLARRFAVAEDIGPSRYIQTRRIQHALDLLAGTDLQVNEIATRCGFADVAYFCRQFRREVGMTPTQARRQ